MSEAVKAMGQDLALLLALPCTLPGQNPGLGSTLFIFVLLPGLMAMSQPA